MEEKLCDVRHYIVQFLEKAILAEHDDIPPNFSTVIVEYATFQRLTGYLHAVRSSTTASLAGSLQTQAWERCMESSGQAAIACAGVEAAVKATLPPISGGSSLFNSERLLSWLNTKDFILMLLTTDFKADNLTKVFEFVATISERGLILQPVIHSLLEFDRVLKEEQKFVHVLIVASVLDAANLSSYSTQLLESSIEWLERRQASVILSQKLSSILNKLPVCDKDTIFETRLLDLFWKHMVVGRSEVLSDFANSLTNFARHYTLVNVVVQLQDPTLQSHDNAKFLRNCLNLEPSSSYKLRVQEPNQVRAYKSKFWEEIEREYLVDLPEREQRLEELLNFEIPLNRHEILRDCMEWLGMARNLTTGVDNFSFEALDSTRDSVPLLTMQTLEALKEESSIHFQVGQQFETLSAKHLSEYNEFKRSYHQNLQTSFDRCLSEMADVVKNALYSRAKVLACKERAKISVSDEVSSHEALDRMLQNAEVFFEQAKGKPRRGHFTVLSSHILEMM